MSTAAPDAPPKLLTAEEYAALPDDGRRTELVCGEEVEMPRPNFRHGVTCSTISRILGNHVAERGLGWVLTNDSGIVTERDPDTVRGADVAFFSYSRVPEDDPPDGYPDAAPELAVEVLSPSDRWDDVSAKINEYHQAGVILVMIVHSVQRYAMVLKQDTSPRLFVLDNELTLPEVLPDFRVSVRSLFS